MRSASAAVGGWPRTSSSARPVAADAAQPASRLRARPMAPHLIYVLVFHVKIAWSVIASHQFGPSTSEPLRRGRSYAASGAAAGVRSRMKSTRATGFGSHQFQSPASRTIAGTSSARITVASKRIPAASPIPNCLTSRPRSRREDEEREHQHGRRARHELAGAGEAERDSVVRVAGLVVRLPDPRDHEDLVVHREAVEEGEDHQRDPRVDRVGGGDVPDLLGAVALLEDQDDDAESGADRDQVQDYGLDGEENRPERPRRAGRTSTGSRTRGDTETCRRRLRRSPVRPGPRLPASPPCRRAAPPRRPARRRSSASRSCRESRGRCRRRTGTPRRAQSPPGATRAAPPSPTTPGVRATAAATCSTSCCEASPSTSTTKGLTAPGVMPASASASRPITASSVAGPASACACGLAGLSWTPASRSTSAIAAPSVPTAAGRRSTTRDQRHQKPASGVRPFDDPAWHQADSVDPRAEQREHRGQERDRGEHRDGRDQHPADPDRADQGHGDDHHREQADRHRRAGDDHGPAGAGHRLDQRGLGIAAVRGAPPGSGRSSAARSRWRRRGRRARRGTGRSTKPT